MKKTNIALLLLSVALLASCSNYIKEDSNDYIKDEVVEEVNNVEEKKEEINTDLEEAIEKIEEKTETVKSNVEKKVEVIKENKEIPATKLVESKKVEEKVENNVEVVEEVVVEEKAEEETVEEVVVTTVKGSYSDYSPEKVKNSTGNVVLFFHADWCPACRNAEAKILSETIPDNLTILKVNFDDATDLKKKYGVTTQTTYVQIDSEGNKINKWFGSRNVAGVVSNLK